MGAESEGETSASGAAHPEAKPFPSPSRARADIAAALTRARANGHRVLVIFGGNWCHDSRALAGWFATPRFRAMLDPHYEIVWVNVGKKTKNLDIARSYGLDGVPGTPTVLMLDAAGKPLNLADAPTWRNAASRSADAIYDHFARG
ncbi:thioredoxin family protein [Sphingomonas donggukensis]|uniref:Thioredoxin family protein n=1 Tax=Sphingomonas donggukensis TaxID=2949093 RepID=A0ABY4TQV1_9SPHN|nr:thioredoxin family protein [Sphingomonas donggukensis]URW74617.1 thioredoxin family protein [Sphingomonas donggukensis]